MKVSSIKKNSDEDVIGNELRSYTHDLRTIDTSPGSLPLIRSLLRLRQLLLRVVLLLEQRPLKRLAEHLLNRSSLEIIRLEALNQLKKVSSLINLMLFSDFDKSDESSFLDAVWESAGALVSREREEFFNIASDIDSLANMLLSSYSSSAKSPAPRRLGKMIAEYYGYIKKSVDIVSAQDDLDRKLQPEQPLKEILLDAREVMLAMQVRNPILAEYGAGLSRVRHHFGGLCKSFRIDKERVDEVQLTYISFDINDNYNNLVSDWHNPRCPNCSCYEPDTDKYLLLDPDKDFKIDCVLKFCDRKGQWVKDTQQIAKPSAQIIILANVLHEVPLKSLPILLHNLFDLLSNDGVLLIYETIGVEHIEDNYVIWYPKDIFSLFARCGFYVLATPGRIRGQVRGWGFPYLTACLRKRTGPAPTQQQVHHALVAAWEERALSLCARANVLGMRMKRRLVSDAQRYEHFHVSQSLLNGTKQLFDLLGKASK